MSGGASKSCSKHALRRAPQLFVGLNKDNLFEVYTMTFYSGRKPHR
ncbi:unnamed protein product [Mycetohabitans rhizoxinica HKI 454]|uniref:Uncharacterized protein n=1 Tax=Mycetohabitans rhizoxinica (strain DSM 19002 / CIP 109453 / HKI 454) TaxID=882378 RepID=E5ARL4_MYCRK|nr:unnamed protein product [Mycetohabitans rhizoxinica HKI 454]